MILSVMAACRKAKGLSQRDIAKLIDCSQPEVSMMEHGDQPITEQKAQILSNLFNVDPRVLQEPYEEYLHESIEGGTTQ